MQPGSMRIAWLFLILFLIWGAIFGLFSVSSVRVAPAAGSEICCIAQRTPGAKARATRAVRERRSVELSPASVASAHPVWPQPPGSESRSVVWRDPLYSRPPPTLSLA